MAFEYWHQFPNHPNPKSTTNIYCDAFDQHTLHFSKLYCVPSSLRNLLFSKCPRCSSFLLILCWEQTLVLSLIYFSSSVDKILHYLLYQTTYMGHVVGSDCIILSSKRCWLCVYDQLFEKEDGSLRSAYNKKTQICCENITDKSACYILDSS